MYVCTCTRIDICHIIVCMYDIYICIHSPPLSASIFFKTIHYKALFRKRARSRKRAPDSVKEPYDGPCISSCAHCNCIVQYSLKSVILSAVLIRSMATPYREFVRCQTVHVDVAAVARYLHLCCAARSRKNPATTRPTPMCLGLGFRA